MGNWPRSMNGQPMNLTIGIPRLLYHQGKNGRERDGETSEARICTEKFSHGSKISGEKIRPLLTSSHLLRRNRPLGSETEENTRF